MGLYCVTRVIDKALMGGYQMTQFVSETYHEYNYWNIFWNVVRDNLTLR
jgi:hypothetical protein